jgi:hypothetical protein
MKSSGTYKFHMSFPVKNTKDTHGRKDGCCYKMYFAESIFQNYLYNARPDSN